MLVLQMTPKNAWQELKKCLKIKNGAGFTLIESLIYIALFVLILGGGLVGVWQIISSTDKTKSLTVIEQNASFVQRKIGWAMSGGESRSVSGGILTVRHGGDNYHFSLSGEQIMIQKNFGSIEPLTANGLGAPVFNPVSVFFEATTTGGVDGVSYSFVLGGRQFATNTVYLLQ